jgi:hypothetical protein
MTPCILIDGSYVIADTLPLGAIEVLERPNPTDKWVDGAWVPDTDLLWTAIRAEREPLLVEADHKYNHARDNGLDTSAISAYRQALRDITTQPDPANVAWPARPW